VELLAGGFALLLVLAVVGFVLGVLGFMGALIVLPFKLLGFALKAVGALLALPFLLIFGLLGVVLFGGVGVVLFGAGLLALALPLLPFALLAWGIWWLVRRKPATA
jgi:hypothetical protein